MIGIIVTGHGSFATGISSSIELIVGAQNQFLSIDFTKQMSANDIKNKIIEGIDSLKECDRIIILADLQGGTPFKSALELCVANDKLSLIGGINLPLVLECSLSRDFVDNFDEFISQIEEVGKSSLKKFEITFDDEDEEM